MSGSIAITWACWIGLACLSLGLLLTIVRLIRGPTLPDRILALDLITTQALGFIVLVAVLTGFFLYLDIAIALGLVGFLSTVALARYVLKRAEAREGRT
ncbi:MAG: cation:proton antiporter [Lysobacteraceae bacterium]|nr:MAG: cation:proton antiporter [Xanthomonadaceae bacterium]